MIYYMLASKRNSAKILQYIESKDSNFWDIIQVRESLRLFHRVASSVPAYKDFLKNHGIRNHEKVKTWNDFINIPIINKKNYLNRYNIQDLTWEANLKKPLVFTATSGSTGHPTYFYRSNQLDWQYSLILDNFIKIRLNNKGPILVIVCFGMGLWIAGIITYKAFELASNRNGYPISIITPGMNKKDIIHALKKLSPNYEYTILAGYPPFIKDVLEEANNSISNFSSFKLRMLFAAESISEDFRSYLYNNFNIDNKYLDIMNIYGSADIGAMAYEGPASIFLKEYSLHNKLLFEKFFNQSTEFFTLAQFNPLFINFESVDNNIVLTGDSEIPLVRYAIGDRGGVFNFNKVDVIFRDNNLSFIHQATIRNIQKYISRLPFVYIYERANLTITFYGLLIYPEWFKDIFLQEHLNVYFTGRFVLHTKYNDKQNQCIEVNVELKKNRQINSKINKILQESIVSNLCDKSSEYSEIYKQLGSKAIPNIVYHEYNSEEFFSYTNKQKWII